MQEQEFLSYLDKVKKTGTATYKACCPAHEDNDPSLAVSFINDGRILIHCWAGCGPLSIVQSMGLTMGALFPDGAVDHRLRGATPWIAGQRREKNKDIDRERTILAIAQETRTRKGRLSVRDLQREREAFMFIKSQQFQDTET